MPNQTKAKMKAWLVTWERHTRSTKQVKIVAVFNCRRSQSNIRDAVEFLFVNDWYSLSEKMAYARRRNENRPAVLSEKTRSGPLVWCGTNPVLMARLVDDLTVESDENGMDKIARWTTQSGRQERLELRGDDR